MPCCRRVCSCPCLALQSLSDDHLADIPSRASTTKVHTIPTIGFNTEEIQFRNIKFCMWDVGGQERIRALWKHYYHGTNAVIFMVDSCDDADRLAEARAELNNMMGDDELRDVCVLVFANKQDLPNALPAQKVCIPPHPSLPSLFPLTHFCVS
jgi:small GTP-binding protein